MPEVMSSDASQEPAVLITCSAVTVASMPWVFTQHRPLDTSRFISEAKRRGFDLDLSTLRELYRHNLLVPLTYVNSRQVGSPHTLSEAEPRSGSTLLTELRHARGRGRLSDLGATSFKPRLRFGLGFLRTYE